MTGNDNPDVGKLLLAKLRIAPQISAVVTPTEQPESYTRRSPTTCSIERRL